MKQKRKPTPMSLQEVSEIVGILQTAFRIVFVQETRRDGRIVIVAREHFPMVRRTHCFCGGEPLRNYPVNQTYHSAGEEV